ncbi:alpha/beta hydrolase [Gilvimarinus agarilyticus]|uniref:alpha/beta hydrolase n=1 Tax=Gilvimarinus agarilyticus TaxID=679259 RepID=UPI00059FCE31|nr:alpha/beta fold hydrolase [Gilvimarinus agarilyticus]
MVNDVFDRDQLQALAGPAGSLEVSVSAAAEAGTLKSAAGIAIVCHPHPLHGGTMDNKVVTTLMRTYRDLGVAVVRFNFRGVGASEGDYAEGVGERDDLRAVADSVRRERPQAPLYIAGFSFGAAVVANTCGQLGPLQHIALVAPPVPRYELSQLTELGAPASVFQGGQDERVVARDVADWSASLAGEVSYHEFADAGHFFHGKLSQLKAALTQAVLEVADE